MARTQASSGGLPLRFSHLKLENWRNFVRTEAGLEERVFLVGPNASGKSNLLDVFRFLHDLAAVGGGFQQAVRTRGGVKAIRALAARRYSDVGIAVTVAGHESEPLWEYELVFSQDKQSRPLVRKERVARGEDVLISRPDEQDRTDPELLTQTHLEQVNTNREFRDLADFFASVRYLHIVPQLVREPDRSVGRRNDPYGGDFLEQLARTQVKTRAARLRRIREVLRVAVPQLAEVELWQDEKGSPHLRGKYEHWRPQGAWQTEREFSDGTLRLTGLLWATLEGTGPLLLEEPELSLHPEVVRFLPQMFARVQRKSGRQIILSTHSADLLRDDGIGLDEVLLLMPADEGTDVKPADAFDDVSTLLEGGVSLADAIVPRTRPVGAEQLSMFGD